MDIAESLQRLGSIPRPTKGVLVPIPVDVVILTKNEAMAIEDAIRSASDFATVWVVDSSSSDGTQAIARRCGARVVPFEWDGGYPKKKQWALDNIDFESDWVLYLDADERVPRSLGREIDAVVRGAAFSAFDVKIQYTFLGRRLRHGYKASKRILIKRGSAAFPVVDDLGVSTMWEVEGHYQPLVQGRIGRLRASLVHDDPDPLYDYFSRHNRYSDWEAHIDSLPSGATDVLARARSSNGRRAQLIPFKPLAIFVYSYFARFGCLDGRAGLHYAVAQAFYHWQVGLKIQEQRRGSR